MTRIDTPRTGTTGNEGRSPIGAPGRAFTPGRIVALALIALAVVGLAYLRFAPDTGSVSVPAGAKAGDLTLERCDYATENGSYAADCGTLVVPENRADPKSRLIALPVTRIRARSDHPAEPIFRLEGGPGITNMKFAKASRFADNHDVVLVGYRGVDGSVEARLPGGRVGAAATRPTSSARSRIRAYGDAFRACADRLTGRGRRSRQLRPRAAGRRSRGRARGARLRPHRPRERERRARARR